MKKLLLLLFSIFVITSSFAADKESTLYRVEIIVFEQSNSQINYDEQWPEHPSLPNLTKSRELTVNTDNNRTSFQFSNKNIMSLNKEQWALINRQHAKILMHYSWLQPFNKKEKIHIYANPRNYPDLRYSAPAYSKSEPWIIDGVLTLNKTNYFNISTDLLFNIANDKQEETFVIKQKRRLREKEIHYIDHPLVGILITINKDTHSFS